MKTNFRRPAPPRRLWRWDLSIVTLWLAAAAPQVSAQAVGPNVNISGSTDFRPANSPGIATNGDNVVAVWYRQDGLANLRAAISRDGGITWADSILPPGPSERYRGRASVCIDNSGTALCAVYGDHGFQGETIFMFDGAFDDPIWEWRRRSNPVPFYPFESNLDGIQIHSDRAANILYLVFTVMPDRYQGQIHIVRSVDAGTSWSPPMVLSGNQCNTAQVAAGPDGALYVVWEDYEQRAIVGRKSLDHGVSFGSQVTLGTINDNVSFGPPEWHDPSRANILENVQCMDFPAFLGIAVDTTSGSRRGTVYGVWAEHASGTVDPIPTNTVIESEPNNNFLQANTIAIGDDFSGKMVGTEEDTDCDWFAFEGTAGTTIQVSASVGYCPLEAPCRQLPLGFLLFCGTSETLVSRVGCGSVHDSTIAPAIYTLPTTGRYYLYMGCGPIGTTSYEFEIREYVPTPASGARDHRDIVLVRSTDGGATWSSKVRVNDDAPQYDNAIPSVTVDGSGRVHVAWYDRREEPECGARVNTYWTWSEDGGLTFQPSQRVSELPSNGGTYTDVGADGVWQVGDHMALLAQGERLHLLWTQIPIGLRGEIYGVIVEQGETGSPPDIVSVTPAAGAPGSMVEIRGSNLTGVRYVYFHRSIASFTVVDDGLIRAEVPTNSRTGHVLVVKSPWSDPSPEVFFIAPQIAALSPPQARIGDAVQIVGVNFTGATAVRFTGVSTPFTVVSDTLIQTTVPEGASDGPVEVIGPGGTGQFSFVLLPPLVNGINLSWDDCGNHGVSLKTFNCQTNRGTPFELIASFVPPASVNRLIGITADIRVISDGGPLPNWWQIPTCRAPTDFSPAFSTGATSCPAFPQTSSIGAQYNAAYEGPSHARLTVQLAFPANQIGPLDPKIEHSAFKVNLQKSESTNSCPGCNVPVRIELRSIQLRQPAEEGFDPVITAPLTRNVAYWQIDPTPVLVSGFTVQSQAGVAEVRWWATDVTEVREFRIHRAVQDDEYEVVGTVRPTADGEYRWTDSDAVAGVGYRYRLEVVRLSGESLWDGPVEVTIQNPSVTLRWRGAVPNPFAEAVELELETPIRDQTRVSVYDITGHKVVDLGAEPQGDRTLVRWNGRDSRGRVVAPGVYLVRAQAGSQTVVRQVVRME